MRLLLSEVVLGELKKVVKETRESTVSALHDLESQVDEIAESGVLGRSNAKTLQQTIREVKNSIVGEADNAITKICDMTEDSNRAEVIPIESSDIVEAVRIALAAERPAKHKESLGLLQGDCLIVAGLERFVRCHEAEHIVLCSSNTADFATKSDGEYLLHPDVQQRLGGVAYYTNPVDCIEHEIPNLKEAEKEEIVTLGNTYERVSNRRVSRSYWTPERYIQSLSNGVMWRRIAGEPIPDELRSMVEKVAEAVKQGTVEVDPTSREAISLLRQSLR